MIRMLMLLILAVACTTLAFPLLALGQAEGAQRQKANAPSAAQKFRAFLDADWRRWMEEYPEHATDVGFPGQDDRWTDDSPVGIARRKKHLADGLATLKAFHRSDLPPNEQLNFDVYLDLLETASEGLQFGDDPFPLRNVVPRNLWTPITQMGGLQQEAASTA